jgi:hypothetical protein
VSGQLKPFGQQRLKHRRNPIFGGALPKISKQSSFSQAVPPARPR